MDDVDDRDTDEAIRRVLAETHTWAVVGLSDNPTRPAYDVAAFLAEHGKRIVPVHPKAAHGPLFVHGQQAYPTVTDAAKAVGPLDVVDVFVRSDAAGAVADEAIALGARAVWFQLGVIDESAAARVRAAGLTMVMDHCPKIEWPRLGPR
jgi:predicted CoA-binding protein